MLLMFFFNYNCFNLIKPQKLYWKKIVYKRHFDDAIYGIYLYGNKMINEIISNYYLKKKN